jgi:predicted nucleotide-binding protein
VFPKCVTSSYNRDLWWRITDSVVDLRRMSGVRLCGMKKPRLFIGSSKESLDYAYAIHENLEDDAEVTVWSQGIFKLSRTSVESLVQALDRTDFAIFVFAPDDALLLRKKSYSAVRDNVVFELGLFMGKLGSHRTFMVVPKASGSLRIPTDLIGITPGYFNSNRKDRNLLAAFGPFCNQVRQQIQTARIRIHSAKGRVPRKNRSLSKRDLVIIEAAYGIQDHRVNVTTQLNAAIKDNKLHIYVGNQLAGDPCPNMPKNLVVKYRCNNKELEKTVDEGGTLDLPSE